MTHISMRDNVWHRPLDPVWIRDWMQAPPELLARAWSVRPAWPWARESVRRECALRTAFIKVRRDVWDARESRLRAKWESYG